MKFSLNAFSDLLSEFQKYLSDRIPRAVYYVLGLVVFALGAIAGYIVGWRNLTTAWNHADIFYKALLTASVILIFFIAAYAIGSLQSAVERWFQGDLPFRLLERMGMLRWHRKIWHDRYDHFHNQTILYQDIKSRFEEVTEWGLIGETQFSILHTAHTLPRYHIISALDLKRKVVDEVPTGALREPATAIGSMTQHPLTGDTSITGTDLLRLPEGMQDVVIVAITMASELTPVGLIPGDTLSLHVARGVLNQASPLRPSLLVAAQQISRQQANRVQEDLTHLTLAISARSLEQFLKLSRDNTLRVVRLAAPFSPTPDSENQSQPGANAGDSVMSVEQVSDIHHLQQEIAALESLYKEDAKWLRRLQTGHLESHNIRHSLDAITATFTKLVALRKNPRRMHIDGDQLDGWRLLVNAYRNKWIQLLHSALGEVEYRTNQSHKFFYLYYPATVSAVAPTAIGNIFRAVDSYCATLYGIDTTLVLPRLQAVMEPGMRSQLRKAHEQLTLLEWLYLGSIATGILGAIMAFSTHHYYLGILLCFLIFPLPQLVFYPAARVSALDYALALRLAYDRERGKVLTMMGLPLPSLLDQDQEKTLWKRAQQWWEYGVAPGEYTLNATSTSFAEAQSNREGPHGT